MMKKLLVMLGLFCTLLVVVSPATAQKVIIDVDISGLESVDLASFDIDVTYDDSLVAFDRYFLTDALGSISLMDAEDWSFGDDTFGTVNISVLSFLEAEELEDQPDAFILTTLVFDTIEACPTTDDFGIELSYIDLGDAYGDLVSFNVPMGSTSINAVPVPAAAWLLGSGLLGLVGIRRRK